ncbi:prealbumin-like fold domain-containing protein [Dactylosporangium sp. CA-152071]|uniref:prealbumin-like fold domain-containing protein n=1 Tax=Dactylosporangium sp. CA-152071 TaxID=3239933 RepID=UPI003D939390
MLIVGVLLAALLPGAPAQAREGEQPASVSASLRYQITFAARSCGSYDDVMANRVRDDRIEAASAPGRASAYKDGQAVDPAVEAANGAGCTALPGWHFSLGPGQEKKGALSTVTMPAVDSGATAAQVPLLDAAGHKTDKLIDGAVTLQLTPEQASASSHRQLWVQGGTPGDPLLAAALPGYGFGVLRCGADGHAGGNVQWLGFPAGARHVLCFAYYVKSAQAPATLVVKARTTAPAGYQQRFAFDASAGYAADKRIYADVKTDATLVRSSGGQPGTVVSRTPAGWTLTDLSCGKSGAGRSLTATDLPTGTATVTLAPGEVVTCTFTYTPPAAPPGLTLRLFGDAPGGGFNLSVASGGGADPPRLLQAAPAGDGSATVATGADLSTLLPGAYPVTLTAPAGETDAWSLTGVGCGATELKPEGMSVTVMVAAGAPTDCALRVTRKGGSIQLRSVTVGGIGAASFVIAPRGEGSPGWSGVATTTAFGEAAIAQGLPAALPLGDYVVTPLPPLATVEGSWRLSSFACDPGESQDVPNVGADVVPLTAAVPAAKCTASYLFVEAHQLQVTVRFAGSTSGRDGPIVLDVDCTDGSTGRVVLPGDDNSEASLPTPLGFLDPAKCTVQRPATPTAAGAAVAVGATVDPAPGNAPLPIPGTVVIGEETGADVDLYTVTVTVTFTADDRAPTQQKVLDTFRVLPVALIGAGLVGIGLVILLIMVLRSRTD